MPKKSTWLRRKKGAIRLNGRERVQIKTLHGSFTLWQQRFTRRSDGSRPLDCRYLSHTGQAVVSAGLQELCLYYCNRLSFAQVEALVVRVSGAKQLVCEQTLWNWVQDKAAEVDGALCAQVASARELPFPALADPEKVDLYDGQAPEVLVLADAIGVKAQKPTREKPKERPVSRPEQKGPSEEPQEQRQEAVKAAKADKRVDTNVMLIQSREGRFRYVCASLDESLALTDVADAYLRQEWGTWSQREKTPLPIVALTDGARSIRRDLETLFGNQVRVILDWYHLQKRVYEHLSMVAHSSVEREGMQRLVLGWLWRGQTDEAQAFLSEVAPRNGKALAQLQGYLDKHKEEIIDYERRSKTGKWIGSGRMEKGVDQVVGMRQKKKGMSWSPAGSRALAMLKVAELNGEWQRLF